MLPLIVTAPELQEACARQPGASLKIFDLSRPAVHQQLHLPGAIAVERTSLVTGELPATGRLPDMAQLEKWINGLGIHPEDTVVAYDDEGGGWASRFLWNVAMLGHSRYTLLSGGLHAWLRDGFETSPEEVTPPAPTLNYPVQLNTGLRQTRHDILAGLPSSQHQLWDCRSIQEYRGEQLLAKRGGHIPGAHHLDWTALFNRDDALQLYPRAVLTDKLLEAGLTPGVPLTVYCQTHHRSGLAFMVARWLGWPVAAYDGGWSEWGNDLTLPVGKPL